MSDEFTEVTMNPATWSHEMWLAVAILAFIVIAILVLVLRLYKLFKSVGKKRERPNLRPGRLRERPTQREDQ